MCLASIVLFQTPQKRYVVGQIIPMLRRADVELGKGRKVSEVCRMLEIAQQTYYRWRQKYGGMAPEMTRKLKALPTVQHHIRVTQLLDDLFRGMSFTSLLHLRISLPVIGR